MFPSRFASDDSWVHGHGSIHHSLWLDHWRFGLLLAARPHALRCWSTLPNGRYVNSLNCSLMCFRVLPYFWLVIMSHHRYLLHHLSVHLCGRHQLRTVSLPTLSVQPPGWYKPWLRLVHVQCLGRAGTDPHSRVLLHPGTIDSASSTIPYLLS